MPIPAKNIVPSGYPAAYDKLFLRSFLLQNKALTIQLSRYGEVGAAAVLQPARMIEVKIPNIDEAEGDDKALVDGVLALVETYSKARGVEAPVLRSLRITGTASAQGIGASLRLVTGRAMPMTEIDVPNCYAEAANDPNFAALLTQFLGLVATWNEAKGVV